MLIRLVVVAFANGFLGITNGVIETTKCNNDAGCTYRNSFCNKETRHCQCLPSHPVMVPEHLPYFCETASKLQRYCEISKSCHHYDPNTFCNNNKRCKCEEGFQPRQQRNNDILCQPSDSLWGSEPVSDFSDEDDDSSEEEDDVERSYEREFVVPVIVGIVLGTLIVCAWSFAICRLYLKKMERQGRARRKRILKRMRYCGKSAATPRNRLDTTSRVPAHFSPAYSVVPSTVEHHATVANRSHPCDLSLDTSVPEDFTSLSRSPSPPLPSAIPLFAPDEEPLPGYDTSLSKESICIEEPPSYQEVMSGEEYIADHRV